MARLLVGLIVLLGLWGRGQAQPVSPLSPREARFALVDLTTRIGHHQAAMPTCLARFSAPQCAAWHAQLETMIAQRTALCQQFPTFSGQYGCP